MGSTIGSRLTRRRLPARDKNYATSYDGDSYEGDYTKPAYRVGKPVHRPVTPVNVRKTLRWDKVTLQGDLLNLEINKGTQWYRPLYVSKTKLPTENGTTKYQYKFTFRTLKGNLRKVIICPANYTKRSSLVNFTKNQRGYEFKRTKKAKRVGYLTLQ